MSTTTSIDVPNEIEFEVFEWDDYFVEKQAESPCETSTQIESNQYPGWISGGSTTDIELDWATPEFSSTSDSSSPKTATKRRSETARRARRQLQNRDAQRVFRAKQKTRFDGLEKELSELKEENDELRSKNNKLEGLYTDLLYGYYGDIRAKMDGWHSFKSKMVQK